MNNNLPTWFTIRVYGLITNYRNELLVSDEFQLNTRMTKFPGGGLDFGEGTIECLQREMREECQQEIENIRHFYTTDFYQKALFYDDCQLISIYYLANLKNPSCLKVSDRRFDFTDLVNGSQSFRWVPVDEINPDEFTFPIDKHVAVLFKNYHSFK